MPYHARAVRGTVVVAKGRKHVLARVTREHVRLSLRDPRGMFRAAFHQSVGAGDESGTRASPEASPASALGWRCLGGTMARLRAHRRIFSSFWRGSAACLQPSHLVQPGAPPGGVVKFERCAGSRLLVVPTSASTAAASQRDCTESEWRDIDLLPVATPSKRAAVTEL